MTTHKSAAENCKKMNLTETGAPNNRHHNNNSVSVHTINLLLIYRYKYFCWVMDSFLAKDYRKDCKYGEGCYQKNPEHKAKFKHPTKTVENDNVDGSNDKENKVNEKKSPPKKRVLSEDTDSEVDNDDNNKKLKLHTMSSSEESQEEEEDENKEPCENQSKEKDGNVDEEEEVFEDLLKESPESVADDIKMKYQIAMPEDFFIFYDLCKSLNSSTPLQALSAAGLKLCGPYDTLAGNIPEAAPKSEKLYLTHGRCVLVYNY